VAAIRARDDNDTQYLSYQVVSGVSDILAAATGSTFPSVDGASFRNLIVPIPPPTEQRAIAQALSDVDGLIGALDKLIAKKRAIKQAAMQQLLTGKTRLPGFSGEWTHTTAGEVGHFRGGNGFPVRFQGASEGKYPFYKVSDMNNVGNEVVMQNSNNYVSEATRSSIGATVFPSGCIVFAKVGAAVFLERKRILGSPSCIDNNMMAYEVDDSVADRHFIHALLSSIRLGDLVETTALPALGSRQLSAMELRLPPLIEQKAIATVLSDMDAEIAALERRREKTKQIKQGMMQQLLTGRIRLVTPSEAEATA